MPNERDPGADLTSTTIPVPTRQAYSSFLWTVHVLARAVALERLKLRSFPSMAFPPREVEAVIPAKEKEDVSYTVWSHIGGLSGGSGPLPLWLNQILASEEPIDDREDRESPLSDFLDIFSNRFLHLWYRAWLRSRPAFIYESGGKDSVSKLLYSLLGLANTAESPSTEQGHDESDPMEQSVPPSNLLAFVGTLGHKPRSSCGLQAMLSSFFDSVPVTIEEFRERKVPISAKHRPTLSQQGARLGRDFILGSHVRDIGGKFRVSLGPMDYETFIKFLPGEIHNRQLGELVQNYTSGLLQWDILLILKDEDEEKPYTQASMLGGKLRLGYNLWLGSGKKAQTHILFNSPKIAMWDS